ncbi:MAG: hypothetical protein H6601_03300 [Flavobacteriales bacterium]|nr:hypothetical protein [Flavobacteriales bacterium]
MIRPSGHHFSLAATGGIQCPVVCMVVEFQNVPIDNGQNGWVEIPNSNSETFDPGMLTESMLHPARVTSVAKHIGESNVVCIGSSKRV